MRLGDQPPVPIEVVSSGSLLLDRAIGVGGLPRGRIVELYGPEASGKSTLALHAIASVQQQGGTALLIDSEHAFDPVYAAALGIETSSLLVSQPDSGEQALEIADQLLRTSSIDLVVVDSVAALVPQSELAGEVGHSQVGAQARMMSQALRKLTATIHKANAICLFINQVRQKIGLVFGNPETTSGGNALRFYASLRIEVRRGEQLQEDTRGPAGHKVNVKIVKNKVAPPFRKTTLELFYGTGVCAIGELLDIAVAEGLVQKAGSWYTYGEEKLGQGREAAKKRLATEPPLREDLLTAVQRPGPAAAA